MESTVSKLRLSLKSVLSKVAPGLLRALQTIAARHSEDWPLRVKLVQESPDNEHIRRVADAGTIKENIQTMHNGIKIMSGSYYGSGMTDLLRLNRGVHEPQEERVFDRVLSVVAPGGIILELGAYWGFYSMWFCSSIRDAKAFLIEPEKRNLISGRRNFELNKLTGNFTNAYVGSRGGRHSDQTPITTVDEFVLSNKIEHLSILHSDIQGFELEMLAGARRLLSESRVDFIFISTHSEQLHHECEDFLRKYAFMTIASATPNESYANDGILVMRASHAPILEPIAISRRNSTPQGPF